MGDAQAGADDLGLMAAAAHPSRTLTRILSPTPPHHSQKNHLARPAMAAAGVAKMLKKFGFKSGF